jgi:hypothetical protein
MSRPYRFAVRNSLDYFPVTKKTKSSRKQIPFTVTLAQSVGVITPQKYSLIIFKNPWFKKRVPRLKYI